MMGAAGMYETIYTILLMNNDFMAVSANIEELVDETKGTNILTERKDGLFSQGPCPAAFVLVAQFARSSSTSTKSN